MEGIQGMAQAMARVYTIFYDYHTTPPEVMLQTHQLLYIPPLRPFRIGRKFDKRNIASNIDFLHQIGHKHKAAIQYPNKNGVLVLIGHVELDPDQPRPFLDLIIADHGFKLFLVDMDI